VIPLAWEEIVALRLGQLDGPPPDGVVHRIHDDSRTARPGDLFVALNTGTRFVADARGRGAATLLPDDQHAALAALASLVRGRCRARVVAIVGSTGKTSTKDALGALCSAVTPTVFAEASRNNEIGLPLTVLQLEPDTDVLVTEMGMRGLGQIAELCAIAEPHLAVVTSVGPEHLELVGSVENAARANAEAVEALPAGGIAVVPAHEPLLEPWLARDDIEIRRFVRSSLERSTDGRWRFFVAGQAVELELPFDQQHMAENVLAALTAYDALGLPLERAQEGASVIQLSRWRGESYELPGGGVVINDAYNANPTSMRAALLYLAGRAPDGPAPRRVAVLGEMAELGLDSDRYHAELGALLRELGVDVLVAVGDRARLYLEPGVPEMYAVPDADAALAVVEELLRPGDHVLVKASRAVGLEGIPGRIEKIAQRWSEF
jgi:UDP-N-acetylmuramoyl-tripeptide--D-alanyl-D-alanine ligase